MLLLVPVELHECLDWLQWIENQGYLKDEQKKCIKAIKTEVWFLETFLLWKGKQNFKKHKALKRHIKVLMRSVKNDLSIWYSKGVPTDLCDSDHVLNKIWLFKQQIRAYYSYPEIPISPVFPPTHEIVVKFIDNIIQNLKDLVVVRLGDAAAADDDDNDDGGDGVDDDDGDDDSDSDSDDSDDEDGDDDDGDDSDDNGDDSDNDDGGSDDGDDDNDDDDASDDDDDDDEDSSYLELVKDQMKVMEKELTLLKNFVYFLGTIYNQELQIFWKAFLSHVEVVATNVAIVYFLYLRDPNDTSMDLEITSKGSLLKTIEPIDPRVCHIYTDVLRNLNLSNSPPMSSRKLLSLTSLCRIVFNELPLINNIEEEMSIRFFTRLENVAIDAGLIVYSLYDNTKDEEDQHQGQFVLADTVYLVKTQVNHDIRVWLQSRFPKNDTLGSTNFLLESLKELLCCHSDSIASVKNQLERIHEELGFLQPLIDGTEQQQVNNGELRHIATRIIDKTRELEHTVDSLEVTEDIPLMYLKIWLSVMIGELKIVITELPGCWKKEFTIASTATNNNEEPVGFMDVKETIRGKLVGGSRELDVISIVSMPGSGKTTLARSFMNDQSIVSHFNIRAECRVSQVYTRKDLLLSILNEAIDEPTDLSKEDESELAARLKQTLMRRRYFVIIDDVWEKDAWDDLKLCFPDDKNGSRIILTTRLWEVALYTKHVTDPHDLRLFENEESWLLLQRKVFGEEKCPEELKQIGQEIAEKCKGLPLSVVLVAGVLARMDKNKQCWKQMLVSLVAQIQGGTKDLVQLSYYSLPHKLKSCFLYFGAFLEDREILVSKLTRLWIAESFIEKGDKKALEDIAEDYLEDLIGRNLLIVTKRRSIGKIKACRVHDLVLDFCKEKAEEQNLLLWLKRDRPGFYSNSDGDSKVRWSTPCTSGARSILFREVSDNTFSVMKNASGIFSSFKFLRVLDLEFVIVSSFPKELRNLRYFAVQTTMHSIPSSIDGLKNLETFQVKGKKKEISLPDTFWKLIKLRHVQIRDIAFFRTSRDMRILKKLATLSSPYISSAEDMANIVRKTPNLKKLRCVLDRSWGRGKNGRGFPVLDSLTQLETLKVLFFHIPKIIPTRLNFPLSLRKLSLCKFPVELAGISTIAKLPNLEVLKLEQVDMDMNEWEVRDDEFPQLKFLKLENLNLSKWRASDEAFSCLERLVLHRCLYLNAIPCQFGDMNYLQSIEVKSCNQSVVDSAMEIRETQVDMYQRCAFKLFIQH